MAFFPGKGSYMNRKKGIVKKRYVWVRDASLMKDPVYWAPKGSDEDEDDGPEPPPGSCRVLTPGREFEEHGNVHQDETDVAGDRSNSGRDSGDGNGEETENDKVNEDAISCESCASGGTGNGHSAGNDRDEPSDDGPEKEEQMESDVDPVTRPGTGTPEPVAGPSGINLVPVEEGDNRKRKISAIDYDDCIFDEDYYFGGSSNYDPNLSPGTVFNRPFRTLRSQDYVPDFDYIKKPTANISLNDWAEAGPSGLNLRAKPDPSIVEIEAGPSTVSIEPGSSESPGPVTSPRISIGPATPNSSQSMGEATAEEPFSSPSTGALRPSEQSTDSDLSSSCSHRSLVDRYTHMNISGCEDQTDEECTFSESDDAPEQLEKD